jgi:hypothetical protein
VGVERKGARTRAGARAQEPCGQVLWTGALSTVLGGRGRYSVCLDSLAQLARILHPLPVLQVWALLRFCIETLNAPGDSRTIFHIPKPSLPIVDDKVSRMGGREGMY